MQGTKFSTFRRRSLIIYFTLCGVVICFIGLETLYASKLKNTWEVVSLSIPLLRNNNVLNTINELLDTLSTRSGSNHGANRTLITKENSKRCERNRYLSKYQIIVNLCYANRFVFLQHLSIA